MAWRQCCRTRLLDKNCRKNNKRRKRKSEDTCIIMCELLHIETMKRGWINKIYVVWIIAYFALVFRKKFITCLNFCMEKHFIYFYNQICKLDECMHVLTWWKLAGLLFPSSFSNMYMIQIWCDTRNSRITRHMHLQSIQWEDVYKCKFIYSLEKKEISWESKCKWNTYGACSFWYKHSNIL